jgi:hypothetical protein
MIKISFLFMHCRPCAHFHQWLCEPHQESDNDGEGGDEATPFGYWLYGTGDGAWCARSDALRDVLRDEPGDDAGEKIPVGGMKAETWTLPPPSTSESSPCALPTAPATSMLRVRTRRGRKEEGGDVGEEGLDAKGKGLGDNESEGC